MSQYDLPTGNPLAASITELIEFVQVFKAVREIDGRSCTWFMSNAEMDEFRRLDTKVYLLAHKAGFIDQLPDPSIVERPLNYSDLPPLELFGKTLLPADRDNDGFMIFPELQWLPHMQMLKLLAEQTMIGGPSQTEKADHAKDVLKPQLTVDLLKMTVTMDGQTWDCESAQALRLIRVYASHPNEWISGPELKSYDKELDGAKPHVLKSKLPKEIQMQLESNRKKGTRLRVTQ